MPYYDFDPLNAPPDGEATEGKSGVPGVGLVAITAGLAGVAVLLRRRD